MPTCCALAAGLERTIDNYLYSLKGFTQFLQARPLDQATADDRVAYQVDVATRGKSDSCARAATYALRGFLRGRASADACRGVED